VYKQKFIGSIKGIRCQINLGQNALGKKMYRSRIVWECFRGVIPNKYQIDHIDRNSLNDCIHNLQCLSASDHQSKTCRDNPERTVGTRKQILATDAQQEQHIFKNIAVACSTVGMSLRNMKSCIAQNRVGKGWTFAYYDPDFPGELWKTGVFNLHTLQASNCGRIIVRNIKTFGTLSEDGYRKTLLSKKTTYVHQIVATIWKGQGMGRIIDHVDGNKCNNRPENLEWVSLSENTLRFYKKHIVVQCVASGQTYHFRSYKECAMWFKVSREKIKRWIVSNAIRPNGYYLFEASVE